jgi:outer membrane protein assembly factor BamB
VVYFTSRDGNLYGVRASDGVEQWKFKMGNDLPYENGWDYYLSSPVISEGKLYVGSGDGNLYGFDISTKKMLWKFNAASRIRPLRCFGDKVIFGSMDGYVYALNKVNGSLVWKFAFKGASLSFANFGFDVSGILCSPATGDGIVAIGGRDGFPLCHRYQYR